MSLQHLVGADLGVRQVTYTRQDVALYALAVGAQPAQLDLVYERRLVPLPTYVAALGMWATATAAVQGGYPETDVLQAAQHIELFDRLPAEATIEMKASVHNVYDKGSAAIVEVVVDSGFFRSTYSMYVRGGGGWGGDRGPSVARSDDSSLLPAGYAQIDPRAAALYRLTGDMHPVHIDPEVARAGGLRAPILHGLCTFGTVVRAVTEARAQSPLDVVQAQARFMAPVYPGDVLSLSATRPGPTLALAAEVAGDPVLTGSMTLGNARS